METRINTDARRLFRFCARVQSVFCPIMILPGSQLRLNRAHAPVMIEKMENTEELRRLLERVPARRMRKTLVRCVALDALMEDGEPDFLFTSGKRDRFNLEGVDCIYFAEDEETARAEHRCQDRPRRFKPVCTFFAA